MVDGPAAQLASLADVISVGHRTGDSMPGVHPAASPLAEPPLMPARSCRQLRRQPARRSWPLAVLAAGPHRCRCPGHNPGAVPGPAPGATGADRHEGEGISALQTALTAPRGEPT